MGTAQGGPSAATPRDQAPSRTRVSTQPTRLPHQPPIHASLYGQSSTVRPIQHGTANPARYGQSSTVRPIQHGTANPARLQDTTFLAGRQCTSSPSMHLPSPLRSVWVWSRRRSARSDATSSRSSLTGSDAVSDRGRAALVGTDVGRSSGVAVAEARDPRLPEEEVEESSMITASMTLVANDCRRLE